MSPSHTPPSPSLRQPLVEDAERRRDSPSSLDNRSFQSQEDYLSDLQDDREAVSSLLLPPRKDEQGGGDKGQEREERHDEASSPLSSSFSLPQAACTASHLSQHQERLLLSMRSSQERVSSPHYNSISSCPYSNPPRAIMKEHHNFKSSCSLPPCSSSSSSSSSSRSYGKTPEDACPVSHTKERGRVKKTAISPLSDTSRDSRFSTRRNRKNDAVEGESSREKKGDILSSSSSSFSSPMEELHRTPVQSKKSRSQGRFLTSPASASPPPPSVFPSCSSPSSSSSSPIISSSRMCLPWSSSSCTASSSSSLLYQAYETERLERKRHIRNGMICAGLDLLLLLPLLATLVQTHRNTPFYSISHSLIDVAILHFSRALAIIYAFFRLMVGGGRGRWLNRKHRDRSLSVLIEEEEEIFAAACQGGDYLSDEEEGEDLREDQHLDGSEKKEEQEGEKFTGGTSLSDLLISTKKEEKRDRRRRRRKDRRPEEGHLKWGSEDEGKGGVRTIRRADLRNACSPGKQGELPSHDVEVYIHQTPETSSNRHDKTGSPSSLSSSQRTEEEGVREITPSSSSLSPFSSTSSSSSSTSVSSYPSPSQDLHSGEAKPCSVSSPSGGEAEEDVEQAYRVIGLAICLAEEEERQSGRRVETAKHRISISARILGVCFLCSILKAINFRFEAAFDLDSQLAGSLGIRLPLFFSPSLSTSSSSASSSSDSFFEGSHETRGAAEAADVSVYVEVLLLLLPLIEVIWAVLAPPLEALFLWRVRQHLIEERSLLHRRFLQLQQTQKSLQQEAELRRRNRRESIGEAGQTGLSTLEEEEGDGDKEEDTRRIPRGGSAAGGDNATEEEEEETFETVEFLKLLRPFFWPTGRSSFSSSSTSSRHQLSPPSFWESPFVLRSLAVSTFFCVGVSKGLTLISPLLLGAAAAAAARAAALFAAHHHQQALDRQGGVIGREVGGGEEGGGNGDAVAEARIAAQYVVGFACAAFGSKLFKEIQMLAYQKVQQAAYVEISGRTLSHLLSLPLEWHVKKQMGYVLRATDRGTDACSSLMTYLVLYLLPAIFECIAVCLVFIFHMRHRVLASLLFLSLTLYAWLTLKVTLWRRKWREAQNKSDSTYHQLAIDALTNFETVKMYNAEGYEVERYTKAVQDYQSLGTRIQASLSFLNSSQQAIVYATLVGGLCFTVQSISEGTMGVGDFVTVQMYLLNVFAPLNFLGTIYNVIVRSLADAQNLSHLLGTKPRIVDAPGAVSLVELLTHPAPPSSFSTSTAPASAPVTSGYTTPPGGETDKIEVSSHSLQHPMEDKNHNNRDDMTTYLLPPSSLTSQKRQGDIRIRSASPTRGEEEMIEYHHLQAPIKPLTVWPVGGLLPPPKLPYAPAIEFDNVYFSYYGDGSTRVKGSIRGVSLKIGPCTTCAFVGVSGSGKSTLTKLLMRLLEPDRGRILINGVDITLVTQESLRACIGMVPQDPVMFNATIYDNIAYARPSASFEEVEAAAEAAQILPSIRAMKDGWKTRVGERGLRLSGGERQRVAIARCLLRNPPIVMLDEATSSLDSVTEANIQRELLQLNNNRTALIVAHRLSTIMHADMICVMRAGRIVERGTHIELLTKKGVYFELWKAQQAKHEQEEEEEEEQTIEGGEGRGDEWQPSRQEMRTRQQEEKDKQEMGSNKQDKTQEEDTTCRYTTMTRRTAGEGRCPFLHR
ncbi:abc transporter transmembrane region domain-containing protein [Cystoisospora suis]|uniref:Abc transporter transmembrane region domain-containing protein n=1 Tax=Cystoisospora suis TaxID=483139 RepID=A0A2C6KUM6_9APIC|nr:abc transporter transmembrane region domain-containing protein [Cystoisospora suis]